MSVRIFLVAGVVLSLTGLHAQGGAQKTPSTRNGTPATARPGGPDPTASPDLVIPPDYIIGTDDVLTVLIWRDKDLTGDVVVRPDGKITLPLLNDVHAAGLTPEQLRIQLTAAASKLIEDPNVTVVVKAINSRKVFLTGMVNKPGSYPLTLPTTVMQLIATAGGLLEYAKEGEIRIIRFEKGQQVSIRFNYGEVAEGRNLTQNIHLKPGDTVVVP